MLKYNIKALCSARGITKPVGHLIKAGINPNMASHLINNKLAAIKPAVIEKLCTHLNCTPNDLMEWMPEENTNTQNHPLHTLQRNQLPAQIQNIMQDIPISKLKEFEDKMLEVKKDLLK
jgi:DNA-binding Xre family transcriptional regulator